MQEKISTRAGFDPLLTAGGALGAVAITLILAASPAQADNACISSTTLKDREMRAECSIERTAPSKPILQIGIPWDWTGLPAETTGREALIQPTERPTAYAPVRQHPGEWHFNDNWFLEPQDGLSLGFQQEGRRVSTTTRFTVAPDSLQIRLKANF